MDESNFQSITEEYNFFALRNSWVAFALYFGSLSIFTVIRFSSCGWIRAEIKQLHHTIQSAGCSSGHIIDKHWLTSTGSHEIASTCLTGNVIVSSVGKFIFLFQNCAGSFRCFLVNSKWFCTFILIKASLDLHNHTFPQSALGFVRCFEVGFFSQGNNSIIMHFRCLLSSFFQAFLVLLSWSVHSFFLTMHQIVDPATPKVSALLQIYFGLPHLQWHLFGFKFKMTVKSSKFSTLNQRLLHN